MPMFLPLQVAEEEIKWITIWHISHLASDPAWCTMRGCRPVWVHATAVIPFWHGNTQLSLFGYDQKNGKEIGYHKHDDHSDGYAVIVRDVSSPAWK
jgi:hypothetical protein